MPAVGLALGPLKPSSLIPSSMKSIRPLVAAGIMLAAFQTPVMALTLPPAEDTSTSTNLRVAKTAGKATTLPVSSTRMGLVRFDVGAFATALAGTQVTRARLIIYVNKVTKPGALSLNRVTQDWSEIVTAAPVVIPTSVPLTTIATGSVVAKQFIIVDVTATVLGWLAAPATDFGFSLSTSGTTSVLLSSKEGPGTGLPATLELDVQDAIGAGTLTTSQLADGAVTTAKLASGFTLPSTAIADGTLTALKLTDGTVTAAKLASGFTLPSTAIADGTLSALKLADGAVTAAKLAVGFTLPSTAIANGTITNAMLAAGFVFPSVAPLDGSVTAAKLAVGFTLPSTAIANGTVTNAMLSSGFAFPSVVPLDGSVTTLKLADASVTAAKLAAGFTLPSAAIADASITNAKLSGSFVFPSVAPLDGSVTTAKIADAAVTTAKLAAGAVTTAKIAAGAIGSTEIATGSITATNLSGGVGVWNKNAGTLFYNDGSVGIGINVPADKLHVFGGTTVQASNAGSGVAIALKDFGGTLRGDFAIAGSAGNFSSDAAAGDAILRAPSGTKLLLQSGIGGSSVALAANGNVGIGTATPGAFKLDVNGGVRCIGSVDITSDARFKLNVEPLPSALASVLRLRGVSYSWDRAGFPEKNFNDRRQLGFIAQEVREILPELVSEDTDGYLSVGYSALTPVLVEAIKEQQKTISTLQARIKALEAADRAREERLSRIENALGDRPARAVPAKVEFQ